MAQSETTLFEQAQTIYETAVRKAKGPTRGINRRFSDAVEEMGWVLLPINKSQRLGPNDPPWAPPPHELDSTGWRYPYPSLIAPKGWVPSE